MSVALALALGVWLGGAFVSSFVLKDARIQNEDVTDAFPPRLVWFGAVVLWPLSLTSLRAS